MEIVKDENELSRYISEAVKVSSDHPILLDQYLNNANEIDVDALCDSEGSVVIAGLMEHVEPQEFILEIRLVVYHPFLSQHPHLIM